jgi:transposase
LKRRLGIGLEPEHGRSLDENARQAEGDLSRHSPQVSLHSRENFRSVHPRGAKDPSVELYRDYNQGHLAECPELTAQRLYQEIEDRGYPGSFPVVRRFVRLLRPPKELPAVYRFETPPGLQAQVGWAKIGTIDVDGERSSLWGFIMTIGYSRAGHVEFTTDAATCSVAGHLAA